MNTSPDENEGLNESNSEAYSGRDLSIGKYLDPEFDDQIIPRVEAKMATVEADLDDEERQFLQKIGASIQRPMSEIRKAIWCAYQNEDLKNLIPETAEFLTSSAIRKKDNPVLTEVIARTIKLPEEANQPILFGMKPKGRSKESVGNDDLSKVMTAILHRTRHGLTTIEMQQIREIGGFITYASAQEKQKIGDQRYGFKLELHGTPKEIDEKLTPTLAHTQKVDLRLDEDGKFYLKTATSYEKNKEGKQAKKRKKAKLHFAVTKEDGKPSQLVLLEKELYYEKALKPAQEKAEGKAKKFKLDLGGSSKPVEFEIIIEGDAPLATAKSGDLQETTFFSLNEMEERFISTDEQSDEEMIG